MTFKEGLIRARSHIVFILALLVAFPLILWLDGVGESLSQPVDQSRAKVDQLMQAERIPLPEPRVLRSDELEWGRIAWSYFERNVDPETGLANAADGYPSATMWDTGSYLLALISAERLGIVDRATFDDHVSRALASLGRLPLFENALPNKAYDTRSLAIVDYNNNPTDRGLGWSALDLARLVLALDLVSRAYCEHADAVDAVTRRWALDKLTDRGFLSGAVVGEDGKTQVLQEGRVGYEEYAAKALITAGIDAFEAWRVEDSLAFAEVEGRAIAVDERTPQSHGAQVYATSEPYVLDGLEFGFDTRSRAFAEEIYRAQESRHAATGKLTAVSEGHLDRAPRFAYATVVGNGEPWAVLGDTGERFDDLRWMSTKTAFGWDALFNTPYTAELVKAATGLNSPESGWLEGRYEASGEPNAVATANTNAIILEALHYRAFGPLVPLKGGNP